MFYSMFVLTNCAGGFEKRPARLSRMILKYPVNKQQVFKPVDQEKFESTLKKYKILSLRSDRSIIRLQDQRGLEYMPSSINSFNF